MLNQYSRVILSLALLILCQITMGSSGNDTAHGEIKTNCTDALLLNGTTSNSSGSNISCRQSAQNMVQYPRWPLFSSTVEHLLRMSNTLIGAVSILAILTNSILILVIWVDPLRKLRKSKTTVIIFSLALADLLTGSCSVCYMVKAGPVVYRIIFDVMLVGFTVSMFTLLVFTMERFIATMYPLKIKQYVTFNKTYAVCLGAWVLGAVVGTNFLCFEPESNLTLEKLRIARIALLEMVVLAMLVLNISIILGIRRQSKRLTHCRSAEGTQKKQRQMNAVLTTLIVLLVVTVLPHLVVTQLFHITRVVSGKLSFSQRDMFLRVFPRLFMPFGLLNYVLNPIIYAWRLYDYRASFAALFKRKRNFYFRGGQSNLRTTFTQRSIESSSKRASK